MNKKQIVILGCFMGVVIVIGIVRGLIAIRVGTLPRGFDLVVFLLLSILTIIAIALGIALRDKKEIQDRDKIGK